MTLVIMASYGWMKLPLVHSLLSLARYTRWEARRLSFPRVLLKFFFRSLIPHMLATLASTMWFLGLFENLYPGHSRSLPSLTAELLSEDWLLLRALDQIKIIKTNHLFSRKSLQYWRCLSFVVLPRGWIFLFYDYRMCKGAQCVFVVLHSGAKDQHLTKLCTPSSAGHSCHSRHSYWNYRRRNKSRKIMSLPNSALAMCRTTKWHELLHPRSPSYGGGLFQTFLGPGIFQCSWI